MNLDRLAFVDLETAGANPVTDRITEIGVVTVTGDSATRWSSLVNPGRHIPPYIQALTGISNEMVADAPSFASLAGLLKDRLAGYTFIAHNAQFDYGFLKNEFKRLGQRFQADVICTVKLSRRLFPEFHRHNLDSLIERHGLHVEDRHRALSDAELIWQFWQQIQTLPGPEAVQDAIRQQLIQPTLPSNLDPDTLDDIPETPGVYLFYGAGDDLLHVGRGVNLRQRVLTHFNTSGRMSREQRLGQQVHRIEWLETVGDLGAMLLESRLIRERQPAHNRRLRSNTELCSWRLVETPTGNHRPQLVCGDELDPAGGADLYGLFAGQGEARLALKSIAEAHQLCQVVLGLETTAGTGQPCCAFESNQCRGACMGKEPSALHSARMLAALANLKLKAWPYPGPIGIVERDEISGRAEIHVVYAWCHLGTARFESDIPDILGGTKRPALERDTYRLLLKALAGKKEIIPLATGQDWT